LEICEVAVGGQESALALFVAGIFADDTEGALPLDDAAVFTESLYRSSDFHDRIGF
jgi:hypothetical protein